jgi:hypothetical protein
LIHHTANPESVVLLVTMLQPFSLRILHVIVWSPRSCSVPLLASCHCVFAQMVLADGQIWEASPTLGTFLVL